MSNGNHLVDGVPDWYPGPDMRVEVKEVYVNDKTQDRFTIVAVAEHHVIMQDDEERQYMIDIKQLFDRYTKV